MAEREYAVIVEKGVNLAELEAELTASTGDGPIPDRSVDIANSRKGSKRITHFALTDEEAETLKSDSRVLAIEIPPDQRDDIQIGLRKTQEDTFYRGSGIQQAYANWGLRRCVEETNVFGSSTTVSGGYEYALDGTGVDVVIQDSGIEPLHPEWEDANGISRLQQINWYTESGLSGTQSTGFYSDFDGHGSHCAGIAAGKTYGWAKNARIYAQKLGGLEVSGPSGIPVSDAFDTIRLWHAAKPIDPNTGVKRPTVVNMSWGYFAQFTGNPTSGVYRGTSWNYGDVNFNSSNAIWLNAGIIPATANGGTTRILPGTNAFTDVEVDDMIDEGIHICIAAGNNYYKADISTGTDYNNTVTAGGNTYSYHQGSSPKNTRAFMVGCVDSGVYGANLDGLVGFSTKGPLVNIQAPGSNIASVCSNVNDGYTTTTYPGDENFLIMSISGTSMASPQVAGVCAQYLQINPQLTPAELQAKIFAETKAVMYDTGLDNDYTNTNNLQGAPNRFLYTKYGRQPSTARGSISMRGFPLNFA
jgi:subtilisin family serine protease